MDHFVFAFLKWVIKILEIYDCLRIKFTFHEFTTNVLFDIRLIWLFGKSDIFGKSMFFKKPDCSIICKSKDVFDIFLLGEGFEFIHEERPKPFEFLLLIYSNKGNLIKRWMIKRSKSHSSNDFVINFDDETLMIRIEEEFDQILTWHFWELFWV